VFHRSAGADVAGFTTYALDGFDDLELTPRRRQIAAAMAEYSPLVLDSYPLSRWHAVDIVVNGATHPAGSFDLTG